MARIVQFPLEDGSFIYVEVDEKLPLPETTPETTVEDERLKGLIGIGDEIPTKAAQTFEKALESITPVANAIFNRIQNLNKSADEVEVKFGVKISAGIGAVIASGNGDVNYEITLKWNNKGKSPN